MSQLNVDNIRNRTGSNGGPNFPSGITVAVGQTAYIHGNLQVDGTETIINTETLNVSDKTVGIGSTSNASNTTADGSGIEIFASSSQPGNNKTITWSNTANSWEFGPNDVGLKVGTGITVYGETGIVSATSFKGDGSELTGIDATALKDGSGSVKIQANSDGAEVTGILTATSFVGSGANLTNLPPGGNTFTGIASGSIANDKAVKVCQDGKLLQIASTVTPISAVTSAASAWLNSVDTLQASAAWNPRDKIVYYAWQQSNNGNVFLTWFKANTGDGTLTYSSQVQLNTTTVSTGNEGALTMTYDTTNNHVIVMYNETGGTNGWKYRIGTPSGTDNEDLTMSSQQTFQASVYYGSVCFEPTLGKLVLFYRDDSDGDDPKVVAGQLSGTAGSVTATWGTGVKIDGTNNVDAGSRFDIIAASNSKVLYSWTRTANTLHVGAATINSDNSVSDVSGPSQLTGDGQFSRVAWDWAKDRGVVSYRDNNQSSHAYSRVIDLTSYPTVNKGSDVQIGSITSVERNDMVYNARVENVYYFYRSGGGSGSTKGIQAVVTASGNTISWTADGTVNGGTDGKGKEWAPWNAADPSTTTGAYAFASGACQRQSSSRGVCYTAKLSTTVSNLKSQNEYVGFAAQAYTDGQTATINTYGNLVTTLSGLTTTSLYYVQADGTVGTVADGSLTGYFVAGTPVAGTAINDTTLVIRDPATRV